MIITKFRATEILPDSDAKLLMHRLFTCQQMTKKMCLTWSELFDATLAGGGVDRQEVFEPGDLWVGDATGGAQHGGRPRPLHHLQLGTHVYAREAKWQQVLWKDEDKR